MEEASTIITDLPCKTCRYNLRTLSPTANCPECNTPVKESLATFQRLDRHLSHHQLLNLIYAAPLLAGYSLADLLLQILIRITPFPLGQTFYYSIVFGIQCVQIGGMFLFASAFPRKPSTRLCIIISILAFCVRIADLIISICFLGGGRSPPATFVIAVVRWNSTADLLVFLFPLIFSIAALFILRGFWRQLRRPRLAAFSALMLLMISLIQFDQVLRGLAYFLAGFADYVPVALFPVINTIIYSNNPFYPFLLATLTAANLLLWLTTLHQTRQLLKHRPTS